MSRQPTGTSRRNAVPALWLAGVAWLFCAFGSVAYADDALAILGIDAQEIGDVPGAQLTDALRKRATETPGLHLVQGKDLIEMKMVFGCDGEAPACLAQAGRTLGADKLLYGSLKKADGGRSIVVNLKLLDVRDLTIVKQVNEIVPRRTFAGAVITSSAGHWFSQLIGTPQVATGTIAVQSTPADATVTVDNIAAGHTPTRVRDLRAGPHTVVVQLDGYQAQTHNVDVRPGAIEMVIAHLEREAAVEPTRPPPVGVVDTPPSAIDNTAQTPPRHPGRPAKYAALGLVAGAVVAGAVAIYTWRSYVGLESTTHKDLMSLGISSASAPDVQNFANHPTCSPPLGVNAPTYVSHCDSGNKFAHATTGLWVSAGVLATAGIVSFIVGESMDHKAEKERTTGSRIQQSLRLVPALSTSGGGLQASFEF